MALKKISEVAHEVGLSQRRIREYERAGLIRPPREPRTNDRLFGPVEISQIELLKRLVNTHKFTLQNLKTLLSYAPCWELTGCKDRDACPVFHDPSVPCYAQADRRCSTDNDCLHCPIYRSKERPRVPLVLRPFADTEVVTAGGSALGVSENPPPPGNPWRPTANERSPH